MSDGKLKVIGWVYEFDQMFDYIDCFENYDEIHNAVLEDIIKHGYVTESDFSGTFDMCPVLNNGYKVGVSARGWERLTFKAIQNEEYKKIKKYNKDHGICNVPRAYVDFSLLDEYEGNVHDLDIPKSHDCAFDAFDKCYDMRVISSETEMVKKYDYINFNDKYVVPDDSTSCYTFNNLVVNIFKGKNFEELLEIYNDLEFYNWGSSLGYSQAENDEQLLELLYSDYPREEVEKNGAVLFMLTSD